MHWAFSDYAPAIRTVPDWKNSITITTSGIFRRWTRWSEVDARAQATWSARGIGSRGKAPPQVLERLQVAFRLRAAQNRLGGIEVLPRFREQRLRLLRAVERALPREVGRIEQRAGEVHLGEGLRQGRVVIAVERDRAARMLDRPHGRCLFI